MSLVQHAFRFYNDDGGEATATPYAAENANISWPLDTNIILRMGITHDGSAAPSTSKWMLFAARVGTEAWFEVSTTGAGKLRLAKSGGSPNNIPAGGVATTQRLSAPNISPSPTFVAGRLRDDGSGLDDIAIGNVQCTELAWCMRAISANGAQNADQYKFRALRIPPAAGAETLIYGPDAFTAADDTALTAYDSNWSQVSNLGAEVLKIFSNKITPFTNTFSTAARWTGATIVGQKIVAGAIYTGTNAFVDLYARLDANGNGYSAEWDSSQNTITVNRITANGATWTEVARGGSVAGSTTYANAYLKVTGTNPCVIEAGDDTNGAAAVTYSDSNAARMQSGAPGLGGADGAMRTMTLDNVSIYEET